MPVLENTNMLGPRMGRPLIACQGGSVGFFARELCFFKQEHGPPRGSKPAKTDVLLVLVPLRWGG